MRRNNDRRHRGQVLNRVDRIDMEPGDRLHQDQRWLRQLLDLPPGHNPGKSLVRRLGPPLVHPLDPRHDYIEEERMLWQEMETDLYCGENTTPYNITDNTDTLPLAAEEVDDTYQEDKG